MIMAQDSICLIWERWGVHDPLSELQFAYSPYSYVYGNPIRFNDPTGMIGECDKCPKEIEPNKPGGVNNPILIPEVVIQAPLKPSSLSFMGISNMDAFHNSQDRLASAINNSKAALATEKFEKNLAFTAGTFMSGGSNLLASAGWASFDWWLDYQDEATQDEVNNVQLAALLLVIARKGKGIQDLKLLEEILPALDSTGKVHGKLPKMSDLKKLSKDDLIILKEELIKSVQKRIEKTSELGRDRGHGQRQGAEQDMIKTIEKILEDL